ncbi:hypothetical protein PAXRUDRAFT_21466 [Paxillus rubicundulus Ve08.2h10]|uniref:Uncharacterized protein n=1 Tax=Paxillus rubicundulus Ve08.2h10 TaxID=930991 RepID=A0A0D0CZJ1_9AGAM|nr:hypothetical protein PAXRUDRAFT_21466 [Paxillus rubicundulus Ve08.2h10]
MDIAGDAGAGIGGSSVRGAGMGASSADDICGPLYIVAVAGIDQLLRVSDDVHGDTDGGIGVVDRMIVGPMCHRMSRLTADGMAMVFGGRDGDGECEGSAGPKSRSEAAVERSCSKGNPMLALLKSVADVATLATLRCVASHTLPKDTIPCSSTLMRASARVMSPRSSRFSTSMVSNRCMAAQCSSWDTSGFPLKLYAVPGISPILLGALTALVGGADWWWVGFTWFGDPDGLGSIPLIVAAATWLIYVVARFIWNDLQLVCGGGMRSLIPVLVDATLGLSWGLADGWVLMDIARLDEAAREGRCDLGAGASDGARDRVGWRACDADRPLVVPDCSHFFLRDRQVKHK